MADDPCLRRDRRPTRSISTQNESGSGRSRRGILGFLLACGLAFALAPLVAWAVSDVDADLVPDQFDNCEVVRNGPADPSNQVDSDLDGYGNACDADYDNDLLVSPSDYGQILTTLTGPGTVTDHDGNGIVTITDFSVYLSQLQQGFPGPSGLACAGTVICVP